MVIVFFIIVSPAWNSINVAGIIRREKEEEEEEGGQDLLASSQACLWGRKRKSWNDDEICNPSSDNFIT